MALIRNIFHPKVAYTLEHLFFEKRSHRKRMINHYRDFIQPGDLVFDVGANLGERTKIFRVLGARVIAIEPTKYCSEYLQKLFSNDKEVVVITKALGASEGVGEISINEKLPVLSTMSKKWSTESRFSKDYSWERKETISITTLDRIIELYGRPKFCKIDVEGFEQQVLSGLSSPIPYISFEFLNEFIDDAKSCVEKINSLGNAEFNYNVGEQMDFALPHWVAGNEIFKSMKTQKNEKLWGDIYSRIG